MPETVSEGHDNGVVGLFERVLAAVADDGTGWGVAGGILERHALRDGHGDKMVCRAFASWQPSMGRAGRGRDAREGGGVVDLPSQTAG
jgi:hypothetical protein